MARASDKIALFDMDGTLANYEFALRSGLEKTLTAGESLPDSLWDAEKDPGIKERMRLIKHEPGWWLDLPVMAWGWDVLDEARNIGFDIQILTKGPNSNSQAWAEKVAWVRKHLGRDTKIHITEDKGLIYGTVLVDDYPPYMEAWLAYRPRGLGVVPYDTEHPNLVSYNDGIEAVKERLTRAFER